MGCANILVVSTKRNKRIEDYETLRSAGMFFTEVLLKDDPEASDVEIQIQLKPSLSSEYNSAWSLGAQAYDIPHPKKKGKRLHIVEMLDYMPFPELLKTLAHEMVHVIQSHVGRLRIEGDQWYWKNKPYGNDPYEGSVNDAALPWEKEADKLQSILANRFMRASLL